MTNGESEILFITKNGYSIRFDESDVRAMGRSATGVKAMTLRDGDIAVGMEVAKEDEELLVRSEEHTSELQSRQYLVCRLLLEKKIKKTSTSSFSAQRKP